MAPTYAVSPLSVRAQIMSVLDKVAQEKMGVFSSPHVAHHAVSPLSKSRLIFKKNRGRKRV